MVITALEEIFTSQGKAVHLSSASAIGGEAAGMDLIMVTDVPTNFELKAERTLPSLIGVSTPLERRKAIITTARNNPADFSAFFIFALSFAIALKENVNVTIIAISNII